MRNPDKSSASSWIETRNHIVNKRTFMTNGGGMNKKNRIVKAIIVVVGWWPVKLSFSPAKHNFIRGHFRLLTSLPFVWAIQVDQIIIPIRCAILTRKKKINNYIIVSYSDQVKIIDIGLLVGILDSDER